MHYFISDLHLSENEPEITANFLQFLKEKAQYAESLYILGDFFEFWVGDDEQSTLIDSVKSELKWLADKGVKCYLMHGNRDFLIGKQFAQEAGLMLIEDYHVIHLHHSDIMLCHGDTLCIDDVGYQRFRKIVHQPWLQKLFLSLPLGLRLSIAKHIRAKSKQKKQNHTARKIDIHQGFTDLLMAQYKCQILIHGHTHQQAVHTSDFYTRIVLGDWDKKRISVLKIDKDGRDFL